MIHSCGDAPPTRYWLLNNNIRLKKNKLHRKGHSYDIHSIFGLLTAYRNSQHRFARTYDLDGKVRSVNWSFWFGRRRWTVIPGFCAPAFQQWDFLCQHSSSQAQNPPDGCLSERNTEIPARGNSIGYSCVRNWRGFAWLHGSRSDEFSSSNWFSQRLGCRPASACIRRGGEGDESQRRTLCPFAGPGFGS